MNGQPIKKQDIWINFSSSAYFWSLLFFNESFNITSVQQSQSFLAWFIHFSSLINCLLLPYSTFWFQALSHAVTHSIHIRTVISKLPFQFNFFLGRNWVCMETGNHRGSSYVKSYHAIGLKTHCKYMDCQKYYFLWCKDFPCTFTALLAFNYCPNYIR